MRERLVVHLWLQWGSGVVRTASLSPPRRFVLGDAGDWELPMQVLGAARFELLDVRDGEIVLLVPAHAMASVQHAGDAPFRTAPFHVLRAGSQARIEFAPLAVEVEVEAAEERRPLPLAAPGAAALGYYAVSATAHGLLLAALAMIPRPVDFPEPPGGTVSVVYPITFTPE
jgi:hypothetical protein